MPGNYVIRNPYEQPQIIGVGGNPVPVDLGYDRALAKEEAAQPDLEGGEEQMFATENFASKERLQTLELYSNLEKLPDGELLSATVVSFLRKT